MRTYSRQRGFTLVEIMIAVAVIAILLGIAMPAYNNYSVRAKVSECVGLAATAKLAVNDRVMRSGAAPGNSNEAGFNFSQTEYCGDIRVADGGTVVVETQNTGAADDPVIQFRLDLNTAIASVDWDCEYVSGDPAHVPSSCRALGMAATGGSSTGGSSSGGSSSGGSSTGDSGTGGSSSGGNDGGGNSGDDGGNSGGDDGDSGNNGNNGNSGGGPGQGGGPPGQGGGPPGQGGGPPGQGGGPPGQGGGPPGQGGGPPGQGGGPPGQGGGPPGQGGGPDCENLPPQANPPQCRDGGGPGNGKGKGKRR